MHAAINSAITHAMSEDPTTLVFGEDVAFGGVFRATTHLREKFGPRRAFNTPLSENGIVGFGIGVAIAGHRAIAEVQFADYIFTAMDQIVNEAAKCRYRSGAQFPAGGLTIRAPYGAVGHGGHYHSQSPEAYFCHTPGLRVVMPRNPYDAKGLLLASIRCDDPVIFLEPKALYRTAVSDNVPTEAYEVPLGKAEVVREGNDVTLVAWGAQVHVAEQAADALREERGATVEVVDLRSLLPWDAETVCQSVSKTGRLVVTHEAPITAGFGAEIVAEVTNACFTRLESPPERVCGMDTPFPLYGESLYVPTKLRVLEAMKRVLDF